MNQDLPAGSHVYTGNPAAGKSAGNRIRTLQGVPAAARPGIAAGKIAQLA